MNAKFKVIFGIQFALLILAIVVTLLIGSDSEFVLLFGVPPFAVSALLLLVLVIMLLIAKQYRFLFKVLLANLIAFLIGTAAIFFTGRGYAYYMLKSKHDTIPYQIIPSNTALSDSFQAFVVHVSRYKRKNLFSSEYVLVNRDEWQSFHNGWIDFYRLELEQTTEDKEISGTFRIIGMPRDSIIWMGVGTTKQELDFRDGLNPGDTILLEYSTQTTNSDTLMLVKTN